MSNQSQISASISLATKEKLDRFTESRGLKKNFVVEQALLLFIESHRVMPDEAFIPTRIELEDAAFDELASLLENPPKPTVALQELRRGSGR